MGLGPGPGSGAGSYGRRLLGEPPTLRLGHCPPIVTYEPPRIHEQLDLACSTFTNAGGARMEEGSLLCLSPIFRWCGRDFGGREGVREFVLRYLDRGDARALLEDGRRPGFYKYDWSLNQL